MTGLSHLNLLSISIRARRPNLNCSGLSAADQDGDGQITEDEFLDWIDTLRDPVKQSERSFGFMNGAKPHCHCACASNAAAQ